MGFVCVKREGVHTLRACWPSHHNPYLSSGIGLDRLPLGAVRHLLGLFTGD